MESASSALLRRTLHRSLLVIRGLLALWIALFWFPTAPAVAQSPAGPSYQFPPEAKPVIPPGDDIILYIHGGPGSKLEEASDLANPLIQEGLKRGKRFTVISFDQLSQGYSSMVDPACFVPQLPTSPRPAAPCPRVHPAAPDPPTPSGPHQITFPISATQRDVIHNGCFPCVDGTMKTDVTISKNSDGSGHMTATTTTINTNQFFGFRGGVTVALLDGNGAVVWNSPVQTFGVDLALAGASYSQQPSVDWSNDIPPIPPDKLLQTHYVAIAQRWDPKSLLDDIKSWFNAATSGKAWAELGQVAKNVVPTVVNGAGPVITPVEAFQYNTLLAFSEESIIAFLKQLGQALGADAHFPDGRNIHIIGGSTGGALTLRMGHRQEPWIKKIIAWNPASVWTTFGSDPDITKTIALYVGFARSEESEDLGTSRVGYFNNVFDKQTRSSQPNPEEWYRGNRYPDYQANADTHRPFRPEWPCKWEYIAGARLEGQEIYNPVNRRWHWRLGSEMLLFSFFNNDWLGPVTPVSFGGFASKPFNYLGIHKPTLLAAGDDDDWNEGMDGISTSAGTDLDKVLNAGFSGLNDAFSSLTGKSLQGVVSGPKGTGFPRHWENRWTQVHVMAPLMRNTPLSTLYLPNTGHSIHNERPNLFAAQIVQFLTSGPLTTSYDSNLPDEIVPGCQPKTCCKPQVSQPSNAQFALPNPALLDAVTPEYAKQAVKYLMKPAQPGGKFSDGADPGTYSTRLRPELRVVAQAKSPAFALGAAAASYYLGDIVMGKAFADLSVTGRDVYETFRSHPPSDAYIATAAANILPISASLQSPASQTANQDNGLAMALAPLGPLAQTGVSKNNRPPDQVKMTQAVSQAKDRANQVVWALRNPDRQAAYQLRSKLGWIAVSGEDDPPDRPVNVPSGIPIFDANGNQVSAYPQYDLPITMCPPQTGSPYQPYAWCPQGTPNGISFKIRYTIASLSQNQAGTVVAAGPVITSITPSRGPITGGTFVHVAVAGGSTNSTTVSFGGVTPPQARCDNENCWFTTPANANPVPVNIVVTAAGASAIVPRVSSVPSPFTYTPSPALGGFGHEQSSTDPSAYLVSLDGNAPSSGAAVELKSNKPNVIGIPPGVNIRGVSAPVQLTFLPVPQEETVTLTATYGGKSLPINVVAPAWPPISVSITPGANIAQATVTVMLGTRAPANGTAVTLKSNDPAITIPNARNVITPGAYSTTFPIVAHFTVNPKTGTPMGKTVTLTATYTLNGASTQISTPVPFQMGHRPPPEQGRPQ